MKRLFRNVVLAAGLLAAMRAFAQPNPPLVDAGTAGQYAIYTAAHRLSPGNGSNVIYLVITDNNFYTYLATNNAFYIYITTNTFATFNSTTINNTTLNVSGKAQIKELIVTNGFAPGFTTITTPDSSGTNFIVDASKATYFTYKATNDVNLQYVTNTSGGVGVSGAAVSWRILPNGANRLLTVNSNWVPLYTNIWTMVTSANPGFWQTTVTNATDANGPRAMLLSAVCFDGTFNQTNVVFNAALSP